MDNVPVKLEYEIYDVSNSVAEYPARNIMEDKPSELRSRWSSESTYNQYIILKLHSPALLHSVTFGKCEKPNTGNVRKFKIYGGLNLQSMVKLFEGTLRNDHIPESFEMRSDGSEKKFPVLYVKIIPMQAWGTNFNYCLWYVELRGIDNDAAVKPQMNMLKKYRQDTALRICLKLFRELGFDDCFQALSSKMDVPLEDKKISDLYRILVNEGNFEEAEHLIENRLAADVSEDFSTAQQYFPVWNQILPGEATGIFPTMRGGHQMVIDSMEQLIYLHGGWDGTKELADFWKYNIKKRQWSLISANTESQSGPSARSCHKMVIDAVDKVIYVLGRLADRNSKNGAMKSDFYMYDINTGRWAVLSRDTYVDGGPRLIFKHQMVLDQERQAIYVSGGQIIEPKESENMEGTWLSGFYMYKIQSSTWRRLYPDVRESRWKEVVFKPRMGHCMVFHSVKRIMYIFGGHHGDVPYMDMIAYDVDKDDFQIIADTETGDKLPHGFSQRATLDENLDEIYVHCGNEEDSVTQNSIWVFKIAKSEWSLCTNRSTFGEQRSKHEPISRYGHQLVYDPMEKIHYLLGGASKTVRSSDKKRLDDFWQLQLTKLKADELIRRSKCALRKQRFIELSVTDPVGAVTYLRNDIMQVIDTSVPEEAEELHRLPTYLFIGSSTDEGLDLRFRPDQKTLKEQRIGVFSQLCNFFPDNMVPPRQNLLDFVLP